MKLIIIGAGGYGKTVYDIAMQSGNYESIHFLDDNSSDTRVIGECNDYKKFSDCWIYPAFGNNRSRLDWIERLVSENIAVPTIVHHSAYVSPYATLGVGTVVLPKAVVNTDVKVGDGVIVNCSAVIDHGCVIEKGVHVCLSAVVKAENQIPEFMKIDAGTVIENQKFPLKEINNGN